MTKKLVFLMVLMFNFVFGATYDDGKKAFEKQDYKTAFKIFEELYSKTKDFDQYELGYIYFNGDYLAEGLPQDTEKALIFYNNSASRGNILAMFTLASIYDLGMMVEKNYKEAKKFYERAAIKGHLLSQYTLAGYYEEGVGNYDEDGNGVEADIEKALKWYKIACNNKNYDESEVFRKSSCEKLEIYK